TDTTSTNPTITGTSSPITARGLVVSAFTPTATGFTVTFSKPIVAANVSLFGGTTAKPIQNVTLVGAHNLAVPGSLLIDPSALSIPDFARGPDGAGTIKVPNDSAKGIPVTLSNAPAATKDVVFTLTYNPTLFAPTGASTGDSTGTGSTFTMGTISNVDAAHSKVTFTWHNGTGLTGTVVLGDILGDVPNSAAN